MALLTRGGGRMSFNLTMGDVMGLDLDMRDRMLEQIQEWRSQEDSAARK